MTERKVLSVVNHPFIVGLHFAFQTSDKLCLILDYCSGGDLSKHLKLEKRFTEQKTKWYICEILLALQELHRRDIIYRDLKPDNIVLDSQGHCKLTDFGLSKEGVMEHTSGARSFCGSIAYLAPEMLKKTGHGKAVDWYLLGVVFYEMLTGQPPYYAPTKEELFYNIERGQLRVPAGISNDAINLMTGVIDSLILAT
jgi:serine/threonine protein kinase